MGCNTRASLEHLLGFLLQTFVVARLKRRFGFRLCFLIVPFIALGDATAVAIAPVLATITWEKWLKMRPTTR
jgi:hypothetical protein